MGDNRIGVRKNGEFKAVCTAPSINYTPVGSSTSPLPYATYQDLSNSINTAPTVYFNGDLVYVLQQTVQPSGQGDNPGGSGGIRSGTVTGEIKPTLASSTVRACGKQVVRQGDTCTMNGGNNPGVYVTTQVPSGRASCDTASPATPQTEKEKAWYTRLWEGTKTDAGLAYDHPLDATKGAVKGLWNTPAELLNLGLNKTGIGSYTGNLPTFEMSEAEQAGDDIASGIMMLTGVGGLAKSAGKAALKVGAKALAEDAKLAGNVAKGTQEAANTVKTAEAAKPAGDGVKVVERIKSLRQKYLGRTPGKNSRTGRDVQKRLREEGKLRDGPEGIEFKASDGEWYQLKDADMAHYPKDAVTWWNETGRYFGAKSPEVREWMLNPDNYTLEQYSINRSLGAKLGETYLPPLK